MFMSKRNRVMGPRVTVGLTAAVPLIVAMAMAGPANGLAAPATPMLGVAPADLAGQVSQTVSSALKQSGTANQTSPQDMFGDVFARMQGALTQGCGQMDGFLHDAMTRLSDALGNSGQQSGITVPGSFGDGSGQAQGTMSCSQLDGFLHDTMTRLNDALGKAAQGIGSTVPEFGAVPGPDAADLTGVPGDSAESRPVPEPGQPALLRALGWRR